MTDELAASRSIAALDFELAKADLLERLKFQGTFSETAWRSLTLVNGGAIVALFTFIGNAKPSIEESLLWWGFGCFVLGLALNNLSIMGGFFAQAYFMKSSISDAWNKQAEMHGLAPQHATQYASEMRTGERWEVFAIGGCVLSLVAFIAGAALSLAAVTMKEAAPSFHQQAPGSRMQITLPETLTDEQMLALEKAGLATDPTAENSN
jgi:hypothetical protein